VDGRKSNVTLIAYGPIAQGLLTGKYMPTNPPPGSRGWGYNSKRLVQIQSLVSRLTQAGKAQGGKTPSQVL
jgi:aryl-alcohol dehydrogenase-like predicted oxidoreductase